MRWKKNSAPRPDTYWHRWFAWHPVQLDGVDDMVWLETVWRRVSTFSGGCCETVTEYSYRDHVNFEYEIDINLAGVVFPNQKRET